MSIRNIFIVGLTIFPLIFWPWAIIPYEVPRVWVMILWIEILIVYGLLRLLRMNKHVRVSIVWRYIAVFVIAVSASSLMGVDRMKSLFGNPYRIDGLWTLLHLAALSFFVSLVWHINWEESFVASVNIGSFVVSMWTVISGLRYFILNDTTISLWQGALGVSFGNPVFLTGYLLVTLPCWVYFFFRWKTKCIQIVAIVGFCIQLTAILFTRSWAGYIGILLFFVGWIWLFTRGKIRNTLLPFIVIGLVGVILYYGLLQWQHRLPASTLGEGRTRIMMKAIIGWTKRPIFGWGLANFDYVFKTVDWPVKFSQDVYVDKAHSVLLEIITTSGIVGLLSYLLLVGNVFKLLLLNRSLFGKTLLLIYCLYLFHSQTNVISINEELLFWIVVGIGSTKG